jgi:acetyltransferase-like isoleucine patch superfamily enzyme
MPINKFKYAASSIFPPHLLNIYHYLRVKSRFPRLNLDLHTRLDLSQLHTYKFGEGVYLSKATSGPCLSIGDFSWVSGFYACSREAPISIGKYCGIAQNTFFSTVNHPLSYAALSFPPFSLDRRKAGIYDEYKKILSPRPISIGNDVWIGHGAIVLEGVRIGDGAVVGAGAVVTKDVAPYTIVGGVPAKPLGKKRFPVRVASQLAEIRWWDWPREKILRNKKFFSTDFCRFSGRLEDLIA